MAATVLVGVVLTTLFRSWCAEGLTALVFLVWLAQEAREAFEHGSRCCPQHSSSAS
jgi:hypothetical protein